METTLALTDEHSALGIHVPGYERALLDFIADESDFPEIDLGTLSGWRRAFVEGGYLRQYVERLRELYATGQDPSERPLSCPLCPMPICGVGADRPEAVAAARRHIVEHLRAYHLLSNSKFVEQTPALGLSSAGR
jgi:hypothetical protein